MKTKPPKQRNPIIRTLITAPKKGGKHQTSNRKLNRKTEGKYNANLNEH